MTIVEQASLVLCCDNRGDLLSEHLKSGYYTAEFKGHLIDECYVGAKEAGWKVDRDEGTVLCPQCAGSTKQTLASKISKILG